MRKGITSSAWFHYAAIVVLQLKVSWGMWRYRDLTSGDTSSYYLNAYGWFADWNCNIVWSPLYTAFYGSFLHISEDAFNATLAHRFAIVMVLALLVLAVMRQLLPAWLAWLIAAWWVVRPISFDTLYEVHLFAVIPALLIWLVLLKKPDRTGRGISLAILALSTVLVRNELLVPLGILATASFLFERRKPRGALLFAYGLPLIAAAVMIGFFAMRSDVPVSQLSSVIEAKNAYWFCQSFSFGYQQRNPSWTKSPWTEFHGLMEELFDEPQPTFWRAVAVNPGAVFRHIGWAILLIPNGLQVLLFNSMYLPGPSPDYAPVNRGSWIALVLTVLLLLLWFFGLRSILRNRERWWREVFQRQAWGWLAMLAVSVVAWIVAFTQRPRPSYMFSFGLVIMAVTGICALALLRSSPWTQRLSRVFPLLALLLIVLAPAHYTAASDQPLLRHYRRLVAFRDILSSPAVKMITPGFNFELCAYLSRGVGTACEGIYYYGLRDSLKPGQSLPAAIAASGANVFYADQNMLSEEQVRQFVADHEQYGWRALTRVNPPGEAWVLLQKQPAP